MNNIQKAEALMRIALELLEETPTGQHFATQLHKVLLNVSMQNSFTENVGMEELQAKMRKNVHS